MQYKRDTVETTTPGQQDNTNFHNQSCNQSQSINGSFGPRSLNPVFYVRTYVRTHLRRITYFCTSTLYNSDNPVSLLSYLLAANYQRIINAQPFFSETSTEQLVLLNWFIWLNEMEGERSCSTPCLEYQDM
jgi:hypothetical protein